MAKKKNFRIETCQFSFQFYPSDGIERSQLTGFICSNIKEVTAFLNRTVSSGKKREGLSFVAFGTKFVFSWKFDGFTQSGEDDSELEIVRITVSEFTPTTTKKLQNA